MKVKFNKAKFETNRAYDFSKTVKFIAGLFAACIFCIVFVFCISYFKDSKLNDPKIEKILNDQKIIEDDYTNIFACDGKVDVTIEEDIVIKVTTANYVLVEKFDIKGNHISCSLESRVVFEEAAGAIFAGIFAAGILLIFIYFPTSFIYKKLKEKDEYEMKIYLEIKEANAKLKIAKEENDEEKIKAAIEEVVNIKKKYGLTDVDI